MNILFANKSVAHNRFAHKSGALLSMSAFAMASVASMALLSSCHHEKRAEGPAVPEIEVAEVLVDSVVVYNSYPATIESASMADVVSRVDGEILAKHFTDGQYVRKGQALYTMKSTTYSADRARAEAQLKSAEGQLEYAQKHLEALKAAYKAQAVAEMDVMQAQSACTQAEAAVTQAQAQLRTANDNLSHCTVRAPVSGKITESKYDVGAYVAGGGAPVVMATVYDDKSLTVNFTIPDYEAADIVARTGGFQNALFRNVPVLVGSETDTESHISPVTADITYEAPAVDPSSANLMLKGRLSGTVDMLKAGMYGKVMLPVGQSDKGILVRDASISTDQRGKFMYTVNKNNEVVYTPVTVGELYNDSLRLVKSGLKPGDRYVTLSLLTVRNGEKIKPVAAKAASGKGKPYDVGSKQN